MLVKTEAIYLSSIFFKQRNNMHVKVCEFNALNKQNKIVD